MPFANFSEDFTAIALSTRGLLAQTATADVGVAVTVGVLVGVSVGVTVGVSVDVKLGVALGVGRLITIGIASAFFVSLVSVTPMFLSIDKIK